MKKAAITGATSMLGLALVKQCLARGVEVWAFVRENSPKAALLPNSELLHIVSGDLDQLSQADPGVGDCDVFYHFAWAFTDKAGRNDVDRQLRNVEYTLDALRLAKAMGCKKFVGAGSQAEYGRHTQEKTGPEAPADPQIPYGVAKLAAGKLGSILAEGLGMDFLWVRIFSVYGPGDLPSTMIASTIRKLRAGEHVSFSPAIHRWDYLYAEDAAQAFFAIGEKAGGNQVFCLGSGEGRSLREYIQILADAAAPGAELGFGEIPYGSGTLPHMCADISTLTAQTGWTPKTAFADGIRKMI